MASGVFEQTITLAAGESKDFVGPFDWCFVKIVSTADVVGLQFNQNESRQSGVVLLRSNFCYKLPAKKLTFTNTSLSNKTITFQAGQGDFQPGSQDINATVTLTAGSEIIVKPAATGVGAGTLSRVVSAASLNESVLKASPGTLYGISAINTSGADKFLKFYDRITAPTVGTDPIVLTLRVPVGGLNFDSAIGLKFAIGIAFAFTGGVTDADVTAVAAGDIILHTVRG